MGNFFVRRPIVAMVIAIVILIVGGISALQLPMEQFPDITPPMVQVRANYTGANSLNVEQSVATPLEQQLNGVENMIYMKSTNANDGSMAINISFEVGTDPDMNTVFAQNRASAATAKLPEEVKRLGVTTQKSMSSIVMALAVYSDGRYDQEFLGNYSIINIQDILARTKGVGRVQVMGASDYSMRIWIKPDRLSQLNLTVPEITAAIREQNVIVPGGKFGAEPAPAGTEHTYTVTLPDRLVTAEEFGEVAIRTNKDGSQVKLKDVATIELGTESYNSNAQFKGNPCALIAIYQSPGTNAVTMGEEILKTMDELALAFPEGVTYDIALDATAPITAGLKEVAITLVVALILVILVVFLFIQDWRATLIPTIAIPVSLIGAFAVFPMLGFTINTLSLLGLVLAIGIVVDDAIVVVEAVQVNIEKGMNRREATIAAMKEVTAPVIATTLVLIAVFIPVASMGGITGRLYQQFAITVAVSVCFSSVNALTLSPALASILLRKPEVPGGLLGRFFKSFNKAFDRSSVKYMKITNVVARKITRSVIFIGATVVLIIIVGRFVPGGFIPEEDQGYLFVNVQLPDAASLQRTQAVVNEVETILNSVDEIASVASVSGFNLLSGSMSTNSSIIFVTLKNWEDRSLKANGLAKKLNFMFYQGIKEAQVFAFGPPAIPGLGSGSGFSLMLQDKQGNTPQYLAEQTAKFISAAQQRPEIANIFTTFRANVPQRRLNINRDKALKAGVQLNDLYTTISAFLGGAYINDFNRFGRLYKAYLQAAPEFRLNADQLDMFFVKNKDGASLPLSSLVTVEKSYGADFTNRFNLYRSVEISGSPASGYSSAQALDALEEVANEVLPSGMGYEWANMSYQEKKASGSGNVVFIFALLFVFLILAAQYESWSLPFSILLGTPFAVLGAMLFVLIARFFSPSFENNVFMQISLVMLIAMAAKNAILIVEFAKIKFDEGLSLFDAAIESARLRFRPILMTAFSFILGVLPLVTASGAGAEARKVMGMALLGGMTIATVLGVVMYPMLFVFIGKLAKYEEKRALANEKSNDNENN
ncbi:efflux RND transporter permease subunit [Carboxylicivirga sp. A043]|uniref:efflux RND transporter permease subunit n=1 Tax=Carboxylicivirga litoralis TaxID=2816963 RepID=UPI0021CB1BD3|nr:efflux RND transporter permease subunit [Carboxylicivirga sp. A043]MCU4155737.1 efflux RND transporter permease subunit [Carboxylicivirga sp. A043]